MLSVAKVLARSGAPAAVTLSVAAAVPLLPKDDVRSSDTLSASPTVAEVTSTLTSQLDPAATVPPVKLTLSVLAVAVSVPPEQVLVAFGVDATVIPAGKLSLNSSAVAETNAALLSMVKVSVVTLPCTMLSGANALAKPGAPGVTTFSVADAVPLLPSDDVRSSDTFSADPAVIATTSTCTLQLLSAATVPVAISIRSLPAVAVIVAPVQVVERFGVAAIVIPDGKVSTKAKLVASINDDVLSMVKLRVDVSPWNRRFGLKFLVNPGAGGALTVSVALAVPLLPNDDVISLVVFTADPRVVEVTLTLIEQLDPASNEPSS
ncbi:hypothetical protein TG4357_01681 [Thalassovita gelatinovora]|uniref:Secreted protein n=1 Tax=Thalassovita gelatinovora TaxID=53501 RepID=A0A0P1FA87_THAGE|nr:hypothetical protein TG4357_01681 [Thalassovita gelatinovora]